MREVTNVELRRAAQHIETRGLAKALRALEETRRRNRLIARDGRDRPCALCHEYRSCDACPVGVGAYSICYRVYSILSRRKRAEAAVDVYTRLMRRVRAEIRRRKEG